MKGSDFIFVFIFSKQMVSVENQNDRRKKRNKKGQTLCCFSVNLIMFFIKGKKELAGSTLVFPAKSVDY